MPSESLQDRLVKWWPVVLVVASLVGMGYVGNYRLAQIERTVAEINKTENWQTYAVLQETVRQNTNKIEIQRTQMEYQREATRNLDDKLEDVARECGVDE